jgi:hypothetical protein
MHVSECVFGLVKAHGHCDCCQAMHACACLCVLACTRRMVTVIAAGQCMLVLFCVLLCTRRKLTVIATRKCMHVCVFVCATAQGAWSLRLLRGDICTCVLCRYENMVHAHGDWCEAMHACVGVCVWA